MRKLIIATLIVLMQVAFSLFAQISNDKWEYYLDYGYKFLHEDYTVMLADYSIAESDNPKYPLAWKHLSDREWIKDDEDEKIKEYLGQKEVDSVEAYMREEDGKVYVDLNTFKMPEGELFSWYLGLGESMMGKFSICDPETLEVKTYTPQPQEEVVLYDYTAIVGDRYRSIVFGSVISYVTVTGVSYMDITSEDNTVIGQRKVIEVLPDYAISILGRIPNETIIDLYTIKYASGLGNIYKGNYIWLLSEPYVLPDNGFDGNYVVNNIYNSDGCLIYKGVDFNWKSGIEDVVVEDPHNSLIYDLHGRQVANPQPGSVYIRGGKKFVAK